MQAGGEATYLEPLIRHFGIKLLALITQADIDNAAATLYPGLTDASACAAEAAPTSGDGLMPARRSAALRRRLNYSAA